MKKNVIICIMGVLLLLTACLCFFYRREYIEASDIYSELEKQQSQDTIKEKEPDKEAQKVLVPYNYLTLSDINKDTIDVYGSDVPGKFPKEGITRAMAARIAEAVWYTQFGDRILECRPYSVVFSKGLWVVATYHSEETVGNPYMEIDSKDGRIVRYILGK